MDATADRSVVLTVVVMLGAVALVGLLGVIWLIDHDASPESLLAVTGIVGPAAGALAGILASTRTNVTRTDAARAEGYREAVADVASLDPEAPTS